MMEAQFTYHNWLVFVFFSKNTFSFIYLNATSLGNKHVVDCMYLNYLFDNLAFRKTWFLCRNFGVRLSGYKRERVYQAYKKDVAISFVYLVYKVLFEYSIINFDCKAFGVDCHFFKCSLKFFLDMSKSLEDENCTRGEYCFCFLLRVVF